MHARLHAAGYAVTTEHLKTFGAIDVPKDEYAKMLDLAVNQADLEF